MQSHLQKHTTRKLTESPSLEPEDLDLSSIPLDLDGGLVLPQIPVDPEHDRVADMHD